MKYTWFIVLFFSLSIFSQKKQFLDSVVVSETKINIPFSKNFRSIEIINSSQIQESGVSNIIDLMQQITGLDIRRRGAGGVQADLYIRGGGFDQTLLLIDGMKMDDSQTGHHTLNMLLPDHLIERVEIIKGPAARIYGQNAFNGAINIVTKSAWKSDKKEAVLFLNNISGGSYGNFKYSLYSNISSNNYRGLINYSREKSKGYRYNTDFKSDNLFIKSSLSKNNPNTNIIATLSNRKIGANGFYASPDAVDQYEETQTSLIGVSSIYNSGNLLIKPKIYWRRNQDEYIYVRSDPSIYRNLHKTNKISAEVNFNYLSSFGNTGFGIEFTSVSITSNNLGEHDRLSSSLYIDHTFNLFNEKLTISPGFSLTYFSDLSFHSFPGLDIGLNLNEKLRLYANFGQTFRIPTFTDLYYSDRTTIGNENLEPESASSSEFGIKYSSKNIIITSAIFSRDSKNIIDYVKNNVDDLWQATNIRSLKTSGFETDLLFNLKNNSFLKLGYALINDDTYVSDIIYSKYSLNSLKNNFISKFSFKYFKNLSQNIIFRYAERSDRTNYTIIDSNIIYKPFNDAGEIFLNLNNILSENYWETNLVPMPGRNFIIGYRASF